MRNVVTFGAALVLIGLVFLIPGSILFGKVLNAPSKDDISSKEHDALSWCFSASFNMTLACNQFNQEQMDRLDKNWTFLWDAFSAVVRNICVGRHVRLFGAII